MKEAPSREAGKNQRDLYLEQECRKCGNNWGVRAGALKARGDKGFSPWECRSRWEAFEPLIVMVGLELKENGLLTGLPFQGRQAGCTTQTPSERGMQSARNGDRERRRSRRWMDVLEPLNGMLIKDLGCGLRCKDHLQLQNVPLEMSVISAQTRLLG